MSRDSRLIHTHLLHLREHLTAHNEEISERAAAATAAVRARQDAPARDTHGPVAFELPARPTVNPGKDTTAEPGS